jgi:hypothetical protein
MLNWMFMFLLAFVQDAPQDVAAPSISIHTPNQMLSIGEVPEGLKTIFEFKLVSNEPRDWSNLGIESSCSCLRVKFEPLKDSKETTAIVEVTPRSDQPIKQSLVWMTGNERHGSVLVEGKVKAPVTIDFRAIRAEDVVGKKHTFNLSANEGFSIGELLPQEQMGIKIDPTQISETKTELRLDAEEEPNEGILSLLIPFTTKEGSSGKVMRSIHVIKKKPCVISPSTMLVTTRAVRFVWKDNRQKEDQTPVIFRLISSSGEKVDFSSYEDYSKRTAVIPFTLPDTWFGSMQVQAVDTSSAVLAEAKLVFKE